MEQQFQLLKKFLGGHFVVLLFVVLGLVLYANALGGEMFWDDNDNILNNQFIQNWRYLPKYFSENLIAGAGFLSNYWRPMLLSVFSLEWHLWGNWAPAYHFVNIAFHIANAVLLFFILAHIFKSRWLSIFTALIFLVHPLQTEAVAYVSALGDPLSIFLIFLGLLFYLKFRASGKSPFTSGLYFSSLFTYILALMTKETAIIMPALIFISDFFLKEEGEQFSFGDKLKKIGKAIWPFFVLAGIYILLRATVLNFVNTFNLYNEENIFTQNFYFRLFTFFRILTVYFGLLFWPLNLHMERSVEIATSLNSFSVIFGGLIFFGLLALTVFWFRRFPILSFGILWFFIALAPTSNLVIPINGLLYEHWLYLPLVGIFLILVCLGMSAAEKYNLRKIFSGFFVLFLIFLGALTIDRNKDWEGPVTFYNQTLKYAPNSYRIINNLGMAYADRGAHEQAEEMYQKAAALDPRSPVAYHNLGNIYKETGKIDLAIENFNTAISLDPKFAFSYNALVNLYLENGNYREARGVLEGYLDYSPSKTDILIFLAQIAAGEKDFEAALSYLEKASALEPANRLIQTSIRNLEDYLKSQK